MSEVALSPETLLDVVIWLGRTHVLAQAPTRVQVLIETRPNTRTRHIVAPPTDLRLVVDVSGSMANPSGQDKLSKLEVAKRAILRLLDELTDRDYVLLSVFSTDGRLVIPRTSLHRRSRQRIQKEVRVLQPEMATNISAGLELALTPEIATGALPRVILFTDGQSSSPQTDHPRLVELADLARARDLPLSIYGTGSDYNWSLLQQVAVRAGGGSFLKHVMDPAILEGHMLAELAFLRGTAIDKFEIEGVAARGVTLISATGMMPQIRELQITGDREFKDHTGALDLHRGAQYLVELEVGQPRPGKTEVLFLTFRGRNRSTLQRFEHTVEVPITFVASATDQSTVNEQVRKVLLMLAAAKQADAGAYNKAADLYRRGGDATTATVMDNLHTASMRPDADPVDLGREATTLAHGSVTESYTVDPGAGRRKH